jgi:phosphomannomutase
MKKEIFKSYDIRGIYPTEIDDKAVYVIAQAYAEYVSPKKVVVGHDVRESSPELYRVAIMALNDAGIDVVDIGPSTTEQMYFAVGYYDYDGGLIVTASHNPREYNGIKMVRGKAEPVGGEDIQNIRRIALRLKEKPIKLEKKGGLEKKNIFDDYKKFMLGFIDVSRLKPFKVVLNPNFGFQGQVIEKILSDTPIVLESINAKPDGSFPKGRPDPAIKENRSEFVEKVKTEKADLGVAWDADGDRVFFADENGRFIESYYTTALLAEALLRKEPGSAVLYDVRYTWAVIDTILQNNGTPFLTKVGHSHIKKLLREKNAIYCGEASGHHYFRDFFSSDTGVLPFFLILEMMSIKGSSLSEMVEPLFNKYFISGEINMEIQNPEEVIEALALKYQDADDSAVERTDGLTVESGRKWRFNVRISNTESLFRVNVEADSEKAVEDKVRELMEFIYLNKNDHEPAGKI